jgi:hypothetical protein
MYRSEPHIRLLLRDVVQSLHLCGPWTLRSFMARSNEVDRRKHNLHALVSGGYSRSGWDDWELHLNKVVLERNFAVSL